MSTTNLHIPGSQMTPDLLLRGDGLIRIKGRGLRTDRLKVAELLWPWLDLYVKNPAEITTVLLSFEIINSVSAAVLMDILRKLKSVAVSKKLVIHWYYESDDKDMLERGEYFSANLDYPFNFVETDTYQAVPDFRL